MATLLGRSGASRTACRHTSDTDIPSPIGAPPQAGPQHIDEFEIDVDREIRGLAGLSGVSMAGASDTAQAQAFVAWIAGICAEVADGGGGRVQMGKAATVASRRHARPWRNLACLLARRCAVLAECYGVEGRAAPSGEVIRWLFVDLGASDTSALH